MPSRAAPARSFLAPLPVALGTLPLLALGFWAALRVRPSALSLAVYLLANLVLFLDLVDALVRLYFSWHHRRTDTGSAPTSVPLEIGEFTPYQVGLHIRPYALLVSVHNMEDEIEDFVEALGPHREKLWVIDDASTDGTWLRLQRAGVHCVRGSPNRKKPGAIKELLTQVPPEVVTVVTLDPDVRILGRERGGLLELERTVFEFQRSGKAAATPQVVVRRDGWLARLQAFEYNLACRLGRVSLADHSPTSGAALYRRDALERLLEKHSLSVYAEDLRNALILLGEGEAIYYDERLVIETEGKRVWRGLFSQRVGWSYGHLVVYAENRGDVWRVARRRPFLFYQYLVCMALFAFVFHPLKLLSLALLTLSTLNGLDLLLGLGWIPDVAASDPAYFLVAYLKYTAFALLASSLVASGTREWLATLPSVPVYFFYVLVMLVPTTLGYLNWLSLRLLGRRVYRDHYQDEESLRRENGGHA